MNQANRPKLGLGIGWRPELAVMIGRRRDLGFVELMAEEFAGASIPPAIEQLRNRGISIVPHGVSLSIGSAERPDSRRLDSLANLALRTGAPLVSEHIAFVRGGGLETGHLLPVPRTRDSLAVVTANVREAMAALPVPLALENIASVLDWPESEMDEADFLTEVLDRTGAWLLLDVENIYANSKNHGYDPRQFLDRIPLDRIAYVHVGGGVEREGIYHDTHAHDTPAAVLDLLADVSARIPLPGVMLERDDGFPSDAAMNAEMDRIAAAVARGAASRISRAIDCAPSETGT